MLADRHRWLAGAEEANTNLALYLPREPEVQYALRCAPFANSVAYRATQNAKLTYSSPDKLVDSLLKRPNRFQSRYSFYYGIVQDLVTYGASYIYIDRTVVDGVPRALYAFSPPEISMRTEYGVRYYEQTRWSTKERLPDGDVIKIEERPGSDMHISSGLEKSWPLILSYMEAQRRMLAVWRNGFTASQYIQTPGIMSAEGKEAAKKWLQGSKGRSGPEFGGSLILEGGAELKSAEMPGKEAMPPFLEMTIAQIAACMGVPAYVASGVVETKYDNFHQTIFMAHSDIIEPVAMQISEEIGHRLGARVDVNTNELLWGGMEDRLKLLTGGILFMTTNEAREQATKLKLFDLPQLEGEEYNRVPNLAELVLELQARREFGNLSNNLEELGGVKPNRSGGGDGGGAEDKKVLEFPTR